MAAPPASAADPMFPFDWNINASTHLKKLNQTVTVPQGSFIGSVDLVTGDLTGDIKLPKATSTVQLAGIGLVTATFKIVAVEARQRARRLRDVPDHRERRCS